MAEGATGASSDDGSGAPAAAEGSASRASGARSITDLELAFAENPKSDAYIDLCRAYLEKRRFMEAMVVCKKAARSNPDAVAPRLLLARVHQAQNRLPKAREVLESLQRERPDDVAVLVALGRFRIETGEETTGVADLKRALDLDPSASEATELLEARGVTYPAPPPPPPPTPEWAAPLPGGGVTPDIEADFGLAPTRPGAGVAATAITGDLRPLPSVAPRDGSGVYRVAPQRLEGEDELERLAREAAEEEPPRGRPRTTFALILVLLVAAVVVVGPRVLEKNRAEAIARLSKDAVTAFDRDLYASYKVAADALEEILEEHDDDHPKTLARLGHVYAILLTEHLEKSVRPRLEAVLAAAERRAPEDPHTAAARGLQMLHAGQDHAVSAASAAAFLAPRAAGDQSSVPTFVDLSLGIVELEQGEVDAAHGRLRRVAEFMGNNVRARVWAARAAAGAGRSATAKRYFVQARKAEPRHPGAIAGLALVTLARGDLDEARQALDLFDQLESEGNRDISPQDRALAIFAKSELHRRNDQEGPADVEYERAVRLHPDNADFPFQRGRGLLQRDRLDGAITYLSKAVEMEPSRWTFRVELAEALMLAKRFEEARRHLDFALDKAPNELGVALAQARYLRRTDAVEAEAYLTQVLPERFPTAKVEIGLEQGRYFRAKGDLAKADENLGEAIKAFGGRSQALQGDVLVSFGLVAGDAGRRDEAVKAYRAAARRGNLDALALLASELQNGSGEERREALEAAQRYLAAGKGLRRTEFVQAIADRLSGS